MIKYLYNVYNKGQTIVLEYDHLLTELINLFNSRGSQPEELQYITNRLLDECASPMLDIFVPKS